jgi:hypothetical protein
MSASMTSCQGFPRCVLDDRAGERRARKQQAPGADQ